MPPPPPDATSIASHEGTSAQIFLALGEIKTSLAVMDQKLQALPDHEMRIRALERFRFTLLGGGALGGALAGWFASWVTQNWHHP